MGNGIIRSLSWKLKKLPTLDSYPDKRLASLNDERRKIPIVTRSFPVPRLTDSLELVAGSRSTAGEIAYRLWMPFFFFKIRSRASLDSKAYTEARAHVRRGITRYGTISRRNDAAISGIMVIRGTVAYRRLIRSVAIRAFREGDDPVW